MSLILLIPIFLVIQVSISDDMMDPMMDGLGVYVLPIGEPYDEDMANIKNLCESGTTIFAETREKYPTYHKGTALKVVDVVTPKLEPNAKNTLICKLLSKGESGKALKMVQESNKHIEQAKSLRSQLNAASVDAMKPGTKVTLQELICYLKVFREKYIAIYPDIDSAKDMAKSLMEYMINPIIEVLESLKGKAADKCELPAPHQKGDEFKSILVPFFKAIENIDK